jgi:thymidylate synthase (FAD)
MVDPARLVWITPDAEKLIVEMARVSNPASAAKGENNARLIQYLISHQHWSPFEMASACFEINTTRDIARQILRHRSFSFQEFSQRYAETGVLPQVDTRECRMQDPKNRQSSIPCTDDLVADFWHIEQRNVMKHATEAYEWAIKRGVAKEVARAVLPEGLTPSRMYMAGTIRSWMHYCDLRADEGTQKEHREIAIAIRDTLDGYIPNIMRA